MWSTHSSDTFGCLLPYLRHDRKIASILSLTKYVRLWSAFVDILFLNLFGFYEETHILVIGLSPFMIVWSYDAFMFHFVIKHQNSFLGGGAILQPYQQCVGVLVTPYFCQLLVL